MAPLESAAAVVGGECETVSTENRSCAEAETLKLDKLFIGRARVNGVKSVYKHGIFSAKIKLIVRKRLIFLLADSG